MFYHFWHILHLSPVPDFLQVPLQILQHPLLLLQLLNPIPQRLQIILLSAQRKYPVLRCLHLLFELLSLLVVARVVKFTQDWVLLIVKLYLWALWDELRNLDWIECVFVWKVVKHDSALFSRLVVKVKPRVYKRRQLLSLILHMRRYINPTLLNLPPVLTPTLPISVHPPPLNLQLIHPPLQLLNLLLIPILQHHQLLIRHPSLTCRHLSIRLLWLLASVWYPQWLVVFLWFALALARLLWALVLLLAHYWHVWTVVDLYWWQFYVAFLLLCPLLLLYYLLDLLVLKSYQLSILCSQLVF